MGICPGSMLFSYLHQHTGAISGTMFINGRKICTSYPVPGTDPTNPPGNEQGYNVKFSPCIDKDSYGVKGPGTVNEAVRIEMGDKVTVECLYDVDVNSKRNFPFPGGHHGGVMGLFFFNMVCDPGSHKTPYVCREDTCIPASHGNLKDLATCQ